MAQIMDKPENPLLVMVLDDTTQQDIVLLYVRRGKALFSGGCESHPITVVPIGSRQSESRM